MVQAMRWQRKALCPWPWHPLSLLEAEWEQSPTLSQKNEMLRPTGPLSPAL